MLAADDEGIKPTRTSGLCDKVETISLDCDGMGANVWEGELDGGREVVYRLTA